MLFNLPMASIIIAGSTERNEFEDRKSAGPEYVRPLRFESATSYNSPVCLYLQGNEKIVDGLAPSGIGAQLSYQQLDGG